MMIFILKYTVWPSLLLLCLVLSPPPCLGLPRGYMDGYLEWCDRGRRHGHIQYRDHTTIIPFTSLGVPSRGTERRSKGEGCTNKGDTLLQPVQGSRRDWKIKVVLEKLWNTRNWPKVMEFYDQSWKFTNFAPELYQICMFFAITTKLSIDLHFLTFSAKRHKCKIEKRDCYFVMSVGSLLLEDDKEK